MPPTGPLSSTEVCEHVPVTTLAGHDDTSPPVSHAPQEWSHSPKHGVTASMDESEANPFHRLVEVRLEAECLLGERSWFLLSCYGKLMDGPRAGSYVSGIPSEVQIDIVHRLVRGETIHVHLMHRHRSGHYEASSLRWSQHGLVMVFRDREEPA